MAISGGVVTGVAGLVASSQPTAVVEAEPAAPVNSSPPTVSGTAREGELLSAQRGVWAGSEPIGYGYQWRRCSSLDVCEDIVGASAESYTLTAADVGFSMQVTVTATNAVGWSAASSQRTATVEAKPAAPVNGSPPTVSGTARAGQTLTAGPGSWSGSEPIGYGYQWRRCDGGGGACGELAADGGGGGRAGGAGQQFAADGFGDGAGGRVVERAAGGVGRQRADRLWLSVAALQFAGCL